MSYIDPRENALDGDIQQLANRLKEQRRYERRLNQEMGAVADALTSQAQVSNTSVSDLQTSMQQSLPAYMLPSNVGDINEVAWFFWEQMTFDFGTDPVWSPLTNQQQSFQVTQEAGFLITSISRTYNSYTTAGALAPLQVSFRDRQSSRQFNDNPIPLQTIGIKGKPTILPTPYFLLPNAFFDGFMTSFQTNNPGQATVGTSRHQLSFFGYRMRVEDAEKVLSTILG